MKTRDLLITTTLKTTSLQYFHLFVLLQLVFNFGIIVSKTPIQTSSTHVMGLPCYDLFSDASLFLSLTGCGSHKLDF